MLSSAGSTRAGSRMPPPLTSRIHATTSGACSMQRASPHGSTTRRSSSSSSRSESASRTQRHGRRPVPATFARRTLRAAPRGWSRSRGSSSRASLRLSARRPTAARFESGRSTGSRSGGSPTRRCSCSHRHPRRTLRCRGRSGCNGFGRCARSSGDQPPDPLSSACGRPRPRQPDPARALRLSERARDLGDAGRWDRARGEPQG